MWYFGTLTKVGIIKNRTLPSLKPTEIGVQYFSLSNTCSFDEPAQIFASSYCDSTNYREEINNLIYDLIQSYVKCLKS